MLCRFIDCFIIKDLCRALVEDFLYIQIYLIALNWIESYRMYITETVHFVTNTMFSEYTTTVVDYGSVHHVENPPWQCRKPSTIAASYFRWPAIYFLHFAVGFCSKTVVTCKIKHLQKCFRAVDFPRLCRGRKNVLFYM